MGRFLRFFTLTTASQLVLLVNQLVLLPIQLRTWGAETTADWLVVLAVGNIASVADLGLRNAGHADLLAGVQKDDPAAARRFREIWALARLLFVLTTAGLIGVQYAHAVHAGAPVRPWVLAVTAAFALETLLIVRGMWLDTLGRFARVESVYLGMVGARVVLSMAALLMFTAPPAVLGWILLATAAAAVLVQAVVLPRPRGLSLAAGGFGEIRWRSLLVIRHVVAEPVSNWVRLSLPVVVLAAIAPPVLVTVYVALRAVFGLARQVISQLARYASVRYAQQVESDPAAAEKVMLRAVLLSIIVGAAVSVAVIADNGRLVGRWLSVPTVDSMVIATFAATAIGYGYQVSLGRMTRMGDVSGVARRQYAYLITAVAAAVLGLASRSAHLYLASVVAQELGIAALFLSNFRRPVRHAVVLAFCWSAVLNLLVWILSPHVRPELDAPLEQLMTVAAVTIPAMLCVVSGCLLIDRAFGGSARR